MNVPTIVLRQMVEARDRHGVYAETQGQILVTDEFLEMLIGKQLHKCINFRSRKSTMPNHRVNNAFAIWRMAPRTTLPEFMAEALVECRRLEDPGSKNRTIIFRRTLRKHFSTFWEDLPLNEKHGPVELGKVIKGMQQYTWKLAEDVRLTDVPEGCNPETDGVLFPKGFPCKISVEGQIELCIGGSVFAIMKSSQCTKHSKINGRKVRK